jgi:hypothetical protein
MGSTEMRTWSSSDAGGELTVCPQDAECNDTYCNLDTGACDWNDPVVDGTTCSIGLCKGGNWVSTAEGGAEGESSAGGSSQGAGGVTGQGGGPGFGGEDVVGEGVAGEANALRLSSGCGCAVCLRSVLKQLVYTTGGEAENAPKSVRHVAC